VAWNVEERRISKRCDWEGENDHFLSNSRHSDKAGGRPIVRNFGWTFSGNIIYCVCQWLIWIVLARFGTPAIVGQYSFAQAIVIPIVLFSQLQLRSIQASDISFRVAFGYYLRLRTAATCIAFLVIAGTAVLMASDRQALLVILLVGLARCIESMGDVYFGHWQANEKMNWVSASLIIKGILSTAVIGFLLVITRNVMLAFVGLNVALFLVYVFFDRRRFSDVDSDRISNWNPRIFLQVLRSTLPLGLTTLFISLNSSVPRLFVSHFLGTEHLGLFSVLVSVQVAGVTVVVAMGQAAMPALARAYATAKMHEFRRLVFGLVGFSALLGLGGLVIVSIAGDELITRFFGAVYGGQTTTLIWLSVGAVLTYMTVILGFVATASSRITFQPWAYGLASLITGAGCRIAVPIWGSRGAAFAMIAGALVGLGFYWWNFEVVSQALRPRRIWMT
jgi:O-antigen/teichoic acid export membrane protein